MGSGTWAGLRRWTTHAAPYAVVRRLRCMSSGWSPAEMVGEPGGGAAGGHRGYARWFVMGRGSVVRGSVRLEGVSCRGRGKRQWRGLTVDACETCSRC